MTASMTAKIRLENGYGLALEALSFNKNAPLENMPALFERLASKDHGHNKALRFIMVWLDVTATREWWVQADTYTAGGPPKSSESTMVRLGRGHLLTLDDCADGVEQCVLDVVNKFIAEGDWRRAKKNLPEGFLQRRMWLVNYQTLREIIIQRHNHKLIEWQMFIRQVVSQLRNPELLPLEMLQGET